TYADEGLVSSKSPVIPHRAANRSAAATSAGSRSGYACTIASADMPSATIWTIVATGIRSPRTHGSPDIWLGLIVIRSSIATRLYTRAFPLPKQYYKMWTHTTNGVRDDR